MRARYAEVKDFWRGASELERYDYFVNSQKALPEIRRFHDSEDSLIEQGIQEASNSAYPFAVVEEGCGPGRVLGWLANRAVSNHYRSPPKYVIGVDFELNMVLGAADHLVGKGRSLRGLKYESVAEKLAEGSREHIDRWQSSIRKKVILIRADMTRPHLRFRSIKPLALLPFGTLGNIQERKLALQSISRMCGHMGQAFFTVFRKEMKDIGKKRYDDLAEAGFLPLVNTKFDADEGAFANRRSGFYSKWYSDADFKSFLQQYFSSDFEVQHVADGVGMSAWVRGRNTDKKSMPPQSYPIVELLCPQCGNLLENSELPLEDDSLLVCSKSSFHRYDVHEHEGFL
ncbi:MAG: hypothetical protein LC620_01925, partial [Halobacteriales archaeon]|nr:hypothetical protein [Halobacteriales archaeon]